MVNGVSVTNLPAFRHDPREASRHFAAYFGLITHLDAQIGRALAALRETGQLEKSLFILLLLLDESLKTLR
jgi:arylsulfatase A-like enzyme